MPPHGGKNALVLNDLMGREVFKKTFEGSRVEMQPGALAAGVYFFKIENNGRLMGTGKVVVR